MVRLDIVESSRHLQLHFKRFAGAAHDLELPDHIETGQQILKTGGERFRRDFLTRVDATDLAIIAVTGDGVECLLHRVGQLAELVVAQLFSDVTTESIPISTSTDSYHVAWQGPIK